jgi:hypothetical protein
LTKKQVLIIFGILGLIAPAIGLTLLWFGMAWGFGVGNTNLMNLLWPSNVMVIRGWRSTVPGIMITVSSVAINCLMYAGIALVVRACIRLIAKRKVMTNNSTLNY